MPYDLYPAIDENYSFPPEVRSALALSPELRYLVVPMTEAYRNSLPQSGLWNGRMICNTTSRRVELYDATSQSWYPLAYLSDLPQVQAGIGQTDAAGAAVIIFPKPFTSPPAVTVTSMGGAGYFLLPSAPTTTQVTVNGRTQAGGAMQSYFSWIAMLPS